jgi:hypothetical protein
MSEEEVWKWYLISEDFAESKMKPKEFSDQHNLDYVKLSTMLYRIHYCRITNPKLYAQYMVIHKEYIESGLNITHFCLKSGFSRSKLNTIITHVKHCGIIEGLKIKYGCKPMNFIQVATLQSNFPAIQDSQPAEVIEPQNDLEIIIGKGVKVSIAPNIDTMKVVKIIEFLKDL